MKHDWSKLRPTSKLDQLAETLIRQQFILHSNFHIIQDYVNHKGANFRVAKIKKRVGASRYKPYEYEREFDVIVRQICVERTTYTSIPKGDLEMGLRDNLLVGLVFFSDDAEPRLTLFPSTVWNEPNLVFTDSSIRHSEYGISANPAVVIDFLDEYNFARSVETL
ncbi:MAG: hypothetical protein AAFQ94_24955 [Bacteroidota bacterium]